MKSNHKPDQAEALRTYKKAQHDTHRQDLLELPPRSEIHQKASRKESLLLTKGLFLLLILIATAWALYPYWHEWIPSF